MMDVDDLNRALVCALQVIKQAILHELEGEQVGREVLAEVEAWLPPLCLLNARQLNLALWKAALNMVYGQYCKWSLRLKKKLSFIQQEHNATTSHVQSSRCVSIYIQC